MKQPLKSAIKSKFIALGFGVFFFGISAAHAAKIYVDGSLSADCNGAYDPTSRSCGSGNFDAYTNIQSAAEVVVAGDEVVVREGTYGCEKIGGNKCLNRHGAVLIENGGEAGNPVLFQAYSQERVIIDGQAQDPPANYYGIRIDADHVTIEGFEITNSWLKGVFVFEADFVTIRNCTVYRNNQVYEIRNQAGSVHAGIHYVAGDYAVVENNRVYQNGYGIMFFEKSNVNDDPVGSRYAVIRNNFVYANANAPDGNFGNSGGIAMRFGEESIIEGNVLWDNPDGAIIGLGMINNKILRNIALHHWQDPGNRENYKLTVRGGGANLLAFNVGANAGGRGVDTAWGVGDIIINHTSYHNKQWGYLLEGRYALLFNSIGYDDFYPYDGSIPENGVVTPREIAPSADSAFIIDGQGTAEEQRSRGMHVNSDYNLAGDEQNLPNLSRGHIQNNTINGNPLLNNPDMVFNESDVRFVAHPKDIFVDPNGDGVVTVQEARADVVGRFSLQNGSPAIGAGGTINDIEALVSAAIPDVIQATQDLINWFDSRPSPTSQQRQAANMWRRMLANLQSPNRKGYGELSNLRDLEGKVRSDNERLDMGAMQTQGTLISDPEDPGIPPVVPPDPGPDPTPPPSPGPQPPPIPDPDTNAGVPGDPGFAVFKNVLNLSRDNRIDVDFQGPVGGHVRIVIYTTNGRQVKELYNGSQRVPIDSVPWDGKNEDGSKVAPGQYILSLEINGTHHRKKVIVLK